MKLHFESENILYIGAVATLLLALLAVRSFILRRRFLREFCDKELISHLLSQTKPRFTALKTTLFFISFALLVVAVARPQWGGEAKLVKGRGVDIMLVLDISRSMLARDIKPDRFTRARLELTELIERLKGNRLGLVVFAGTSFVQCPMTTDTAALKLFLKAVSVGSISEGGTALADALATAREGLNMKDDEENSGVKRFGTRAIILLTDGEDHGKGLDEEVAKLKKEGIVVFAVGIGSTEGEPIPLVDESGNVAEYLKDKKGETVLSKLDEETLKKIVEATGGAYIRATDRGVGLGAALEMIESMETGEFESRLTRIYDEGYQYFLAAALFFLFALAVLPERRLAKRWSA
ncbi:MAG: VWA domain-containing protein [Myxococcota bacterium]